MKRNIKILSVLLFTQVFASSVQAQLEDIPFSGSGYSAGDSGGSGGGGGRRRARPAAAAAPAERPDINVRDSLSEFRREVDKVRDFNNTVCVVINAAIQQRRADDDANRRANRTGNHRRYTHQGNDYFVLDGASLSSDQRSALNMDSGDHRVLGTYANLSGLGNFCRNWATRRAAIYDFYDHIDALMTRAGSEFTFECPAPAAGNAALVGICRQMQGELNSYTHGVVQQIDSLRSVPYSGIVFSEEANNTSVPKAKEIERNINAFLSH